MPSRQHRLFIPCRTGKIHRQESFGNAFSLFGAETFACRNAAESGRNFADGRTCTKVEKSFGFLRMRTTARQRTGFRIPSDSLFGLDDRDRRFVLQKRLEKSRGAQSDGNLSLRCHGCRPGTACRIKKHIGVQFFNHFPALFLAESLHKAVKKHQSRA